MEEIKCKQVAILRGGKWDKCLESNRRVYSSNALSPTITTCGGGNQEVKILEEPYIAASRGRMDLNTMKNTQKFEENKTGTSNALTSVQKDNLVCEPTIWGSLQEHCAVKQDGVCPTLTQAMGAGGGQIPMHNYDVRVRKLTERECFRLQGVKDEDFEKIRKNQSKSSCYHLAGDSITTSVLMAIFGEMLEMDWRSKVDELVVYLTK